MHSIFMYHLYTIKSYLLDNFRSGINVRIVNTLLEWLEGVQLVLKGGYAKGTNIVLEKE